MANVSFTLGALNKIKEQPIQEGAILVSESGQMFVDTNDTRITINGVSVVGELPSATEADINTLYYNKTTNVLQYSNGEEWQSVNMPIGGIDGQFLKKSGDTLAFSYVDKVEDKTSKKPIDFQVSNVESENFTIEFIDDEEEIGEDVVNSFNGRVGIVEPQSGDYTAEMVGADAEGSADSALTQAKAYTDAEIKKIPTPDVSAQIQAHNIAGDAHNDIRTLISEHIQNKTNPHTVTANQIGAVPNTTTINNKALTSNITLTASDVNAVPTTRTVNGKALSSNINISASDVGAAASSHNHSAANITSGTLSVSRGGTGKTSLTTDYFLRGNGTSAVKLTSLSSLKTELGLDSAASYVVGTYSGNCSAGETQTINLGFKPKCVIVQKEYRNLYDESESPNAYYEYKDYDNVQHGDDMYRLGTFTNHKSAIIFDQTYRATNGDYDGSSPTEDYLGLVSNGFYVGYAEYTDTHVSGRVDHDEEAYLDLAQTGDTYWYIAFK